MPTPDRLETETERPTEDPRLDRSSSTADASSSASQPATDLEARVAAVERTLTRGETPVAELDDTETLQGRLDAVETALDDLAERIDELEAASSALRGYAGGIQAVHEDVERRADLALAKAERLERSLGRDEGLTVERLDSDGAEDGSGPAAPAAPALAAPAMAADRSDRPSSAGESTDSAVEQSSAEPGGLQTESSSSESAGERSLAARIRDAL